SNFVVTIPVSICDNDSIFAGNAWQTTSGLYYDTLASASGCDSVVVTDLTVNTSLISNLAISICDNDSVFAAGAWQNTSGLYYDTLVSASGCDSVVITDLTVNASLVSNLAVSICDNDSVLAGGAYQNTSGLYYDTLSS